MSKYNVSAIKIDNGVISTDFYGQAKSIEKFFADKKLAIEVFKIVGWKFSRIYLTHGDKENGAGWAFHK